MHLIFDQNIQIVKLPCAVSMLSKFSKQFSGDSERNLGLEFLLLVLNPDLEDNFRLLGLEFLQSEGKKCM